MDNVFDDDRIGPTAADTDYDEVMAKLNASLKRSASVRSSSSGFNGDLHGTTLNGGGFGLNGGSTNSSSNLSPTNGGSFRGGLEAPLSRTSYGSAKKETYLQDVSFDDDYDIGDQLPSIEEARTTAAATLLRMDRSHSSGGSPYDAEEEYEEQYNKFLRRPGEGAAMRRRNNWYRIAFFVLCAALLGIIIGLAVGFTAGKQVEQLELATSKPVSTAAPAIAPVASDAPVVAPVDVVSPAPTLHSRLHQVLSWLVNQGVAKQLDFNRTTSPQFQAAHWLSDQDGANLPIPTTVGDAASFQFIERYVMALFFLATEGKAWSYSFHFFSTDSVCSWNVDVTLPDSKRIQIGVICNADNRISNINIPQNNLVGTLISELGLLDQLDSLALNHNVLHGSVPSELAELTKLSYLALHYNDLDGQLPTWIGKFEQLRVLGMGDNQFDGSIPSQWTKLTNMVTLGLDDNSLTGDLTPLQDMNKLERAYLSDNNIGGNIDAVPWALMTNLEELDLSGNAISGTFPADFLVLSKLTVLDLGSNNLAGKLPNFSYLPSLKYMVLRSNGFTGTIPTTMGTLGNVTHLDLSDNKFSGQIPHQLSNLNTLEYLFFADNNQLQPQVIPTFIGSLTNLRDLSFKGCNRIASIQPTMFAKLNDLVLLELDNNVLTGEVPSELGNLMSLTYLLLNRNFFTGTVPSEIQELPQLDILLLDKTKLEGTMDTLCSTNRTRQPEITAADCYGDVPELNCTCCNICCSDDVNVTECRDRVFFGELDPVWENSYQRRYYQFADQDFGTDAEVSTQTDIGHDDVLGNGSNVTKPADGQDDNNPVV